MATMNVTSQSTDLTAYGSYLATLEVSGISNRNGHQTFRVPFSRLSQTMQQIHRQGGTLLSIDTGMKMPDVPKPSMVAPPVNIPVPETEPELQMEQPKASHPNGGKKRRK
jgi:hypothetical protein